VFYFTFYHTWFVNGNFDWILRFATINCPYNQKAREYNQKAREYK